MLRWKSVFLVLNDLLHIFPQLKAQSCATVRAPEHIEIGVRGDRFTLCCVFYLF